MTTDTQPTASAAASAPPSAATPPLGGAQAPTTAAPRAGAGAGTGSCPRCGAPTSGGPGSLCAACALTAAIRTPPAAPPRFPAPAPAALERDFPQLAVEALIGQGGMGAVYRVRQRHLDRLAALKILPVEGTDPGFAERFTREARTLARLNHPHLVTLFDFGRTGSWFWILMEYVDGANLRQVIATGGVSPDQALALVPPLCAALQYAHDEGVVHRDIKPENILIDRHGHVKLGDFGLAKLTSGPGTEQPSLTQSGVVMGTLHYMAPEQVEHSRSVDHRADIYALGVVLYEMLTGGLPLGRFDPPSRAVQVDVRIDDVVLRALEKDPRRRYQHASEVRQDLQAIGAPPSGAASGAPPAPSASAPAPTPAQTWARWAVPALLLVATTGVAVDHQLHGPGGLALLLAISTILAGWTAWRWLALHPAHRLRLLALTGLLPTPAVVAWQPLLGLLLLGATLLALAHPIAAWVGAPRARRPRLAWIGQALFALAWIGCYAHLGTALLRAPPHDATAISPPPPLAEPSQPASTMPAPAPVPAPTTWNDLLRAVAERRVVAAQPLASGVLVQIRDPTGAIRGEVVPYPEEGASAGQQQLQQALRSFGGSWMPASAAGGSVAATTTLAPVAAPAPVDHGPPEPRTPPAAPTVLPPTPVVVAPTARAPTAPAPVAAPTPAPLSLPAAPPGTPPNPGR